MRRALGLGAFALAALLGVAMALAAWDGVEGDAGVLLAFVYGMLAGYGAVAVGTVAYWSGPER